MKNKSNLERRCKKYGICPDRDKCDGKGSLDYGRLVQVCDEYLRTRGEVKK